MNKELINSAIAKITEEALSIKDAFSQMIEEHLTDICKTDAVATKLLAENKSLKAFVRICGKKQEANLQNVQQEAVRIYQTKSVLKKLKLTMKSLKRTREQRTRRMSLTSQSYSEGGCHGLC